MPKRKRSASDIISSTRRPPASPVCSTRRKSLDFSFISNEEQQAVQLPSPPYDRLINSRKRKIGSITEEETRSLHKRKRLEDPGDTNRCGHSSNEEDQNLSKEDIHSSEDNDLHRSWSNLLDGTDHDQSVAHWAQNQHQWADCLRNSEMMERGRNTGSQKRSLSRSNSYTQSTRSGDTPKAWGAEHAASMLDEGIYMERQEGATIIDEDLELCTTILDSNVDLPDEWRFKDDNFSSIIKFSLYKNEAGVRDQLAPHLMPSPELHDAMGFKHLGDIVSALDATWTKCTSLCGPKSKPDACHGISRFTFSREEREKLTSNEACLTGGMMFPFYICEAKCFNRSIEESELQALHGASVACSAIIKLYQRISAVEKVHRRILVFSMSHNQKVVKIFGHFALINGDKITYHRHRILETNLVEDVSGRSRPYQIARAIWSLFFPIHLDRVRDALKQQRSRALESFTASVGLEGDSVSGARTPTSSQEDDTVTRKLQEENTRLLDSMLAQQVRMDRQQEQHERQLAEQREESRQQCAQLEHQLSLHTRQLEKQLAQQEKQLTQQKEDSQKQLALLEQLLARFPQPAA